MTYDVAGEGDIESPRVRRAVLFADVCDSTAIYQSIGDAQALALINRLFARLDQCVAARSGDVVKTLGDGMVCQFADADSAFRAACDMQVAALDNAAGASTPLSIKIGFTYGPVVPKGADVFGDTVNVCARLAALGGPEQVLTTKETVDALSPGLRLRARPLYPIKVRGRSGEVTVCNVLWRSDPDVTETGLAHQGAAAPTHWVLKLSAGGETVVVDAAKEVTVGRDKSNHVVVPSTRVSRVHARIFGRAGHFVIADLSSNGTYLLMDGTKNEVLLRREEGLMGERGWIGLGASASSHGDHVLRYRTEPRG